LIGIAVLVGGWEGATVSLILGAVVIYLSIRSILTPLAVLTRAAQAMAQGSYEHRIVASDFDETSISRLGQALNSISGDLAARLREIAEDRQRLETVLGATLEGVMATDHEGKVTLMNQAAQRLLGVSSESCLGRALVEACHNMGLAELAGDAVSANALRTKEIKEGGKTLEVYATPLRAGTGVVLVIHDVTEMRRLETLRRDFVANVSHELKTPLTSIRAYVETLLDGGLDDRENNLRFLKKIEVHASRLVALIADLLSLSKVESGDAFPQRMRVDLGELVQGSYQRLGPNAESKTHQMQIQFDAEPVYILADTEAVTQIFDNLIDNAIKYTEPGGRIDICVRRDGERARVDVMDTGIGIPQEDLPRIFERFYRVDKARSRELGGTGLGLSIAKHLVQALGGELAVESRLGAGSTFTTWFPLAG
jgi:PAS domain S-box-containing protein